VPLSLDIAYLAEQALLDHLPRRLVHRAVAPLQADLQHLLRLRQRLRLQRVNFLRLEHKALFAEDVLAGVQRVARHRVVEEQRRGDEDRLHLLVREQLAVVLVAARIAADGLLGLVQRVVADVADGDARAGVNPLQVLQQVGAAAAGAHHAVFDRIHGGASLQDRRRAFQFCHCRAGNGGGACRLHRVAAGHLLGFSHASHPRGKRISAGWISGSDPANILS